MALTPIAAPRYPNVPKAPGVPPVVRQVGAIENTVVTLVADAVSIARLFLGPQWGIFDSSGQPILIGDAVASVDFRREFRISDYPVEDGGFATYEKIAVPFDVRVTFAVSGQTTLLGSLIPGGALIPIITGVNPNAAGRSLFLANLDAALSGLTLVSVFTPEASYNSCNVVHTDYRRAGRRGATLIEIDVWLVEVRVTGTQQFTNTQSPSSASPQSGGGVQATPPTTSQLSTLAPSPTLA